MKIFLHCLQQRFPTFLSLLPTFDVTNPQLPKSKKKPSRVQMSCISVKTSVKCKKKSSPVQMSCIPVESKKKVFTYSHVLYSSAGSENPGENGVIFPGVFNSPPEYSKIPTGWELGIDSDCTVCIGLIFFDKTVLK